MKERFFFVTLFLSAVLSLYLAGCSETTPEDENPPLDITDVSAQDIEETKDNLVIDVVIDVFDISGGELVNDATPDIITEDITSDIYFDTDLSDSEVFTDISDVEDIGVSDADAVEDTGTHKCSYKEVVYTKGLGLVITVDLKDYRASKYYVEEEIKVEAESDGDTITLFGNGHTVNSVEGEYVFDGSKITICVPPYKKGEMVSAKLTFTVNSNDDLFGLRRWRLNYQESAIGPFTEPYFTHYWLFVPQSGYDISSVFDYNIVLNEVNLTIRTPDSSWKAYSIGGAKSVSDNVYTFEYIIPIPLYSLSFAVSNYYTEFDAGISKSGVNVKGLALKSNLSKAKQAFASAVKTIDRMEEIIGSYDLGKILQLADIPQFGGGMEHTTIIWIGSDVINAQSVEAQYVTAHEVVHHWWGDNLMFADWPHFWLAEGFTEWSTIYEAIPLITDSLTAEKIKYYWRSYAAEEYSQYGVPLRFSDSDDMMNYFNEVLDQFYKYGSSVVEMILLRLERDFGKERYDFLSKWFDAYRHKTATTEDLRQFLVDYTGDYYFWEKFFNEWVYSTPCPTLKITDYVYSGGTLSFKIQKTKGIQSLKGLEIRIGTNQGEKITSVDIDKISEIKEVKVQTTSVPDYIAIDPEYYFVFVLDKTDWNGPYADFSNKKFSNILLPIRPDILKLLYRDKYKRLLK